MPSTLPLVAPIYLPGQEPLPPGLTEEDRANYMQANKYAAIMSSAMESCAVKCAMSGAAGFALGGFFSLLGASLAVDDPLRRSNLMQAQVLEQQARQREATSSAAAAAAASSSRSGGVASPALAVAGFGSTSSAHAPLPSAASASAPIPPSTGVPTTSASASTANPPPSSRLAPPPAIAPELSTAEQTKLYFRETGRNMWRSAKGFGRVGALYSGLECCIEGYRAKSDMQNPLLAGFFAGAILARNSGPSAMLGGGAAFAAFSGAIELYLRKEKPDDP